MNREECKDCIDHYDPTALCCAWCYATAATLNNTTTLKKCANCPRHYCSRECQKNDWSTKKSNSNPGNGGGGHHKFWCGKSGEKGADYTIRPAMDISSGGENSNKNSKGMGLFALRDFKRGEKILVERPVMIRDSFGSFSTDVLDKNVHTFRAFMALAPSTSSSSFGIHNNMTTSISVMEKFSTNSVALAGDEDDDEVSAAVFVHFSRVNHDCIGNTQHYFEPIMRLRLLVANDYIPAGTEITFSYAQGDLCQRRKMMISRGFQCHCQACLFPDIDDKLSRIKELDTRLYHLGSQGRTAQAVQCGHFLIRIYDELKLSDVLYLRTYYDMFSMSITRKKNLKEGTSYLRKAHEHALRFYGWEENEVVQKYSNLLKNPSSHHNYCLLG